MDSEALGRLLREQDGVAARSQVLALAGTDNDIERLVRRRDLTPIHPGTYLEHTGPPSWRQRARAAVLHHRPAALSGASALCWAGVPDLEDGPVELVVPRTRCVVPAPGVTVRRIATYSAWVLDGLSPPRVALEHAVLELASRATSEDAAMARIGEACQSRRTTPERLLAALGAMPRLPRRRYLLTILDDAATGAYSVLERRYLTAVERPHGLPTGRRQRRVRLGRAAAYRDVDYLGLATVVELDGRLGHEATTDRWADLDRDLAAVVEGTLTVRIGWRQVLEPCRLAGLLDQVLRARGWDGAVRRCGPACSVASRRVRSS